jgi:hypothetical protein
MIRMTRLVAIAVIVLAVAGSAQARPAPKPIVGPIFAEYYAPADLTYYAINAAEPRGLKGPLTITWSLKPPAGNKSCSKFAPSATSPKVAIWDHGAGDGCTQEGLTREGPLGTVKVVVRDASWVCTATYLGTDSGSGDYAVCVPRNAKH